MNGEFRLKVCCIFLGFFLYQHITTPTKYGIDGAFTIPTKTQNIVVFNHQYTLYSFVPQTIYNPDNINSATQYFQKCKIIEKQSLNQVFIRISTKKISVRSADIGHMKFDAPSYRYYEESFSIFSIADQNRFMNIYCRFTRNE